MRNEVQFVLTEQELVGHDLRRHLPGPGEIAVGAELAVLVFRLQLDPVVDALGVIEAVEHVGLAELAVVEQVRRVFPIAVDADLQVPAQLLIDPGVEIMRALRQHRAVLGHFGRSGRIREQRDVGWCGDRLHRRGEIAGVAGVKRGAGERLVDEADARAELVGIDELEHLVEAQADVERELVGDPPLVLDVGAEQPAELRIFVVYAAHDVGRRRTDAAGVSRAGRKQEGLILDARLLAADEDTGAQRVRVVEANSRIFLDAVEEAAAIDIRRDPVEDEVADRVRREMHRGVAAEVGHLQVDIVDLLLQRGHVVVIAFVLALVEQGGIEAVDDRSVERKTGESRRLPGIVGDLELAQRRSGDEAQARVFVEQGRGITEELALPGVIVQRIEARRRVLDALVAGEIAAGDEILGLADGAAVFEFRRDGLPAAAVDADAAAVVERAALGGDVDEAGGAQAVLRRQSAGDELEIADQPGLQHLAEPRDAVGQQDAVDAVLHVAVLVAHVDLAAGGGILGDTGRLQQQLVDRRVGALRQRLDRLSADVIGVGAHFGQDDVVAGAIERRVLLGEHRGGIGRRRSRRGGGGRGGRGGGGPPRSRAPGCRLRRGLGLLDHDLRQRGLGRSKIAGAQQRQRRARREETAADPNKS